MKKRTLKRVWMTLGAWCLSLFMPLLAQGNVVSVEADGSFESFLSLFSPMNKNGLDTQAFFNSRSNDIDLQKFGRFLPLSSFSEKDRQVGAWLTGKMMREPDCIVACVDIMREGDVLEQEKLLLVTYSPQGQIVDSRLVGMAGEPYIMRTLMDATNRTLTCEMGTLKDIRDYFEWGDLHFRVITRRYTVLPNGRIKEEIVGKTHKETVARDRDRKEPGTFDEYLGKFAKHTQIPLENSQIDLKPLLGTDTENASQDRELEGRLARMFAPEKLDCDCWPREMSWTPCYYVDRGSYILAYLVERCAWPHTDSGIRCLYADGVIATYTRQGKQIDSQAIWRQGDYFEYRIESPQFTDRILVTQASLLDPLGQGEEQKAPKKINTRQTEYAIDSEGKITANVLNDTPFIGTWTWDHDSQRFLWEKVN